MFQPFWLFVLLYGIGVLASLWVNDAIYRWSYYSLPISSWQKRKPELGKLHWAERLPVVGWFLRSKRQADIKEFGRWFWVRPALIELIFPWVIVGIFVWLRQGNIVPDGVSVEVGGQGTTLLWAQYNSLVILLFLLTIATFIDFDEYMIPDIITLPGTLIGLLGSTFLFGWNFIEQVQLIEPPFTQVVRTLHANSPESIPASWRQGQFFSLLIVLMCWSLACISLVDFPWITRRGWKKAFIYAWVRFWQAEDLRKVGLMLLAGWILLPIGYFALPEDCWDRLVSSMVGMCLGGALVLAFRIVATEVLGLEALGFGDVTLMAMVGAFLGWQLVWLAFFLAPLFGIVIVLIRLLLTGDNRTPFGPYLSAASVYLMLDWKRVWGMAREWMFPATIAPWVLIVLLFLLGTLLWIIHRIERLLGWR